MMCNVGKMDQSAACLGGRQQFLAAFVILVSTWCALVTAQIDVNETGLHGGQGVYGLVASPTPDPNVNAQDITVFGWGETDPSLYAIVWFNAYGISANVNLVNNGDVSVTATGGRVDLEGQDVDVDANTVAYGVFNADGNITNRGQIGVTALGGTASSTSNSSPRTATAAGEGYGLYTHNGAIDNSGTVTVMAQGGQASADGSASAGATACGVLNDNGDVGNSGDIRVTATGGTATADDNADVHSLAQGLRGTNVNNAGTLSVTATAGTTTAPSVVANAEADGIAAGGNVNNSGAIRVAATAPAGSPALAYGIRMDSSGNLTNTGVIQAFATTAYELYVASGTTTLVNTYNVTLDGDPDRGSLAVADGATLALNNANLTVTGISGQTLWDTPYNLFDIDSSGVVDGNFASVQPPNPNTTVTYYDQGTAGSVDDAVSLAYTPAASQALISANAERQLISQVADVVNNYMGVTVLQDLLSLPSSGLLASAGSTAESLSLAQTAHDKTTGVFLQPFYSQIDNDADPLGYDAKVWGIAGGFQRFVDTTLLNLHLGYGRADIEYTGCRCGIDREDQDLVIGGFDGLTRWNPWTLRYGVDGFYGWHNYEGLTGWTLEDEETASYNSYGVVATLLGGHIFQWGTNAFLPEAGVNWVWLHRERYTTEATDPTWDTLYAVTNDYDLYGVAALRWLSSFACHDIRISPSASVGVRHLLTDDETSVWQSVEGATPVLVEAGRDRTELTVSGSLLLSKTPQALSLAYDGSFSPDTQRHSFWLRYSWQF